MTECLLPTSVEAEQAVLAACVYEFNPDLRLMSIQQLRPEDFTRPDHQTLFAIIRELTLADKAVNQVSVIEALKARDDYEANVDSAGYLFRLIDNSELIPTTNGVQSYIDILIDRRERRDVMRVAQSIMEYASDINNPDPIPQACLRIEGCAATVRTDWKSGEQIASGIAKAIDDIPRVLKYNLRELDRIVGGITMQRPELTVIGARSSHGKTAFANRIATNVAFSGYRTLYYSLETIGKVLCENMAASMAGINLFRLRHEGYDRDEADKAYSKFYAAMAVIENLKDKLLFMDEVVTLPQICVSAEQAVKKYAKTDIPVGAIILDFVQLVDPGVVCRDLRTQMVHVMKTLHTLTRKTQTPVVALSQVTMKSEDREKPVRKENLAEAPNVIINLVDKIIMIHNPFTEEERTKPRPVTLFVDKFKLGSTGRARCVFYPTIQRFADVDEEVIYDD